MLFYFLSIPLILDIVCIIHIVKTRNERYWIYIVIFAPVIGSVAYIISEILPSLLHGRKTQELGQAFSNVVFGGKKITELENLLAISDTYRNRHALANAYLEAGMYDKAASMFLTCLSGAYSSDPHLIQTIGHAYFLAGDFENSKTYFDRIKTQNQLDKKYTIEYARALEKTSDAARAEDIYKLLEKETSIEGIYRYAQFLAEAGREQEAKEKYKHIVCISKTLPRFVYRENNKWISFAKQALKQQ